MSGLPVRRSCTALALASQVVCVQQEQPQEQEQQEQAQPQEQEQQQEQQQQQRQEEAAQEEAQGVLPYLLLRRKHLLATYQVLRRKHLLLVLLLLLPYLVLLRRKHLLLVLLLGCLPAAAARPGYQGGRHTNRHAYPYTSSRVVHQPCLLPTQV